MNDCSWCARACAALCAERDEICMGDCWSCECCEPCGWCDEQREELRGELEEIDA